MNFCHKFGVKNHPYQRCKGLNWKSKVSLYIMWYMFGLRAGEIWAKSYGQKLLEILTFLAENLFFKAIFDKKITTFWKKVLEMKQLLNAKL